MTKFFCSVSLIILTFNASLFSDEHSEVKKELGFIDLFNGKDLSNWVDVNTSPETWKVKDEILICSGQPIGVMRSKKQLSLIHI